MSTIITILLFLAVPASTASTFIVTSLMDSGFTSARQSAVVGAGRSRAAYYPDGWTFVYHRDDNDNFASVYWVDGTTSCSRGGYRSSKGCYVSGPLSNCWSLLPSYTSSLFAEYTFDRDFHSGIALSMAARSYYTLEERQNMLSWDDVWFSLTVAGETKFENLKAPHKDHPFTYRLKIESLVAKGTKVQLRVWCGPNKNSEFDALQVSLAIEAQCSDSRAISGVTGTRCNQVPRPNGQRPAAGDQLPLRGHHVRRWQR